jgi:hypothetical protein
MFSRHLQDMFHIPATGITGSDRIVSGRQSNLSTGPLAKFHDHFRLGIESMHMSRFMVLWIGDKTNTIEPKGAHAERILQNRLDCFSLNRR